MSSRSSAGAMNSAVITRPSGEGCGFSCGKSAKLLGQADVLSNVGMHAEYGDRGAQNKDDGANGVGAIVATAGCTFFLTP